MNEEIKKISHKILEFLTNGDSNYRANTLVDCAGEDELPIVLLGLIDKDPDVRKIAADVIGAAPHNFIAARDLLEKLYLNEQDDEVKVNMIGTLKKWGSKEIHGKDINEEFQKLIMNKNQNFVNWANLKFEK